MKFIILHETAARMRIHMDLPGSMTCRQADLLQYYTEQLEGVIRVKVSERTCNVIINYDPAAGKTIREGIIKGLQHFQFDRVDMPEDLAENSGREMGRSYKEKIVLKTLFHYGNRLFLPRPLRMTRCMFRSMKFYREGLGLLMRRKLEVPVLDATAIGVSMARGDIRTASSVMFLLEVGELLEEWTHKKSVGDLARIMSLNVDKVWRRQDGQDVLVPYTQIKTGDQVLIHMGNVIAFDGTVLAGEAMVNQASLTGESLPVRKCQGLTVYAGTVVEEGELLIEVKSSGDSRYEKIVTMIEDSEKLKSNLESKAEHLADRLVPYTFAGTGLTYLLTRDTTRTLSVLMVDFSCALKLAMPISVLSAIREAGQHRITVKGGKFLEAVAEADTIVFDKTGTLTKARPRVARVFSFNGEEEDELLRISACLEEHFPHSIAKAVVDAAEEKGLNHDEMHSKVEYIVAHGIATTIGDKRAVIGSYHFVFEDEACQIPEGKEELFKNLPEEYSHLYLAIEGKLAAVICIEDPIRQEAREAVGQLRDCGLSKIVMMTGDSLRTAAAIAGKVGVDEFYAEVLPEDKASFVQTEREKGRKVMMVGDGINDSPALSAADVGIAIGDGAELAREVADITIGAESLFEIVTLKQISDGLIRRIQKNYRIIVGINSSLILLGVLGIMAPTRSALLHNLSTIAIGIKSMEDIL